MDIPRGWTWRNAQPDEWPERRIVGIAEVSNFLNDGETRAQLIVLVCRHYCVNSYGIWSGPVREDGTMRCWTCFARGTSYEVNVEHMPPQVRAVYLRIVDQIDASGSDTHVATSASGEADKNRH